MVSVDQIVKIKQRRLSKKQAAKMKKQMSYADSNNIPFVALVGENEMKEGKITLKDMKSGEQELVDIEEIVEKFKV